MKYIKNGIWEIGHRRLRPARFKVELPSYPNIAGNSLLQEPPPSPSLPLPLPLPVKPTRSTLPASRNQPRSAPIQFTIYKSMPHTLSTFFIVCSYQLASLWVNCTSNSGSLSAAPAEPSGNLYSSHADPVLQPVRPHARGVGVGSEASVDPTRVPGGESERVIADVLSERARVVQGLVCRAGEVGSIFETPRVRVTTYEMARRLWMGMGATDLPYWDGRRQMVESGIYCSALHVSEGVRV
ncbi:hypothetical protein PAAG_00067 [Paracoccidioides lutzii Pb01]|uniref:Uncharacterized protein n=1 Tax=Paracoccidioides lutzii (strain ATCC MYA-826 / Pb01) TaxID=502779 RepID=C1GNH2_PARBA|nr:hypothetical protein PAAG_00067 [Paracoccidioides lutzii Pb01]EEH35744.2 hypothetical protein PAAG_00067 [Paracoccidioides lutzii Pb01]